MRLLAGCLLLCAWLSGCASAAGPAARRGAAPCTLTAKPELIARSGGELHQVWQIPEAPVLYSARQPADQVLASYTQAVRARADVDPIALLRRQHDLYVASGNAALLPEAKNSALARRASPSPTAFTPCASQRPRSGSLRPGPERGGAARSHRHGDLVRLSLSL